MPETRTDGSATAARAAAEATARASYGRLVAWLAAGSRDITRAEDALAEALCTALRTWPDRGIPTHPEAWLLTVARRRLQDARRHGRVTDAFAVDLRAITDEAEGRTDPLEIPDRRLGLLFACAHPAIDPALRAPLMLQAIFGLDAACIAAAFLVAPATMGQRLVRAKSKIRDAGIPFVVPKADELAPRLDAVLEAIYAAYGSAWDDVAGADPSRRELAGEALWLARLTAALLPDEPEATGLYALLLYCEARRAARRSADGAFIPLSDQDPALWSMPMIGEAERALGTASRQDRIGRFQLEAAIQSAHVGRLTTGSPDWHEIALLYSGLVAIASTAGARVSHAAAIGEAEGPVAALAHLGDADDLAAYQPTWALRGHLLDQLGETNAASEAYARAAAMTSDAAISAWLGTRRAALADTRRTARMERHDKGR